MDRKEFLGKSVKLGFCSSALFALNLEALTANASAPDEKVDRLQAEKTSIVNWLADLLGAFNSDEVDANTPGISVCTVLCRS